jgi:hypothetical protein
MGFIQRPVSTFLSHVSLKRYVATPGAASWRLLFLIGQVTELIDDVVGGYGTYKAPAGGYGSYPAPKGGYTTYKKSIEDLVKRIFGDDE